MYANQVSTDFLKNQCAFLEKRIGRKLHEKDYTVNSVKGSIIVRIDPSVIHRLKGVDLPERVGPHPVKFFPLKVKSKADFNKNI
jgi:hypothetical protein